MEFCFPKDKLKFAIIITFLLLQCSFSAAKDEIMPLKDVKPGMKGIGKTVIHGREIETFNIEVLGILSNNKINENLQITGQSILVRVSGKVIDEAGGIAAGMSGSPIYINGKLIGGLSSGWVMTDHTVGMVTPIEEMLEIWDYPLLSFINPSQSDSVELWASKPGILINNKLYHTFRVVNEFDDLHKAQIKDDEAIFIRAATPVFIQGLGEKATNFLKNRLRLKNLQVAPSPSKVPTKRSPIDSSLGTVSQMSATYTIEPGSAIGVQLARGDINLSTLGTLTYRDGKKILAFAHPFLKKGNASYLLTAAHIYHCFSSVQMPFKIGAPMEVLGIITQDREKGISGEIGRFPNMIPVHIEITDKDLKRSRNLDFQVVRDPTVLTSVIESTFLQGLESVIDRTGEGTGKMGLAIEYMKKNGAKSEFRREDLFYSRNEICNTLISEVIRAIELITENEIEEAIPTKISCKIEIEQKRRTLTIEKVEIKNTSITPGGTLEVWVTLRPYREKSIVKKAKIPIPNDIGKDDLRLTVYGLTANHEEEPRGTESQDSRKSKESKDSKESKSSEPLPESIEALMKEWANAPQNSDLLFQLSTIGVEEKKIKFGDKTIERQPTNMVVIGSIDTTIALSED